MRASGGLDLEAAAHTWREHGWVLVEGLIDSDDVDAAVAELSAVFPPADVLGSADDARSQQFWARRDPDLVFGDARETGPAFRPDQLLGTRELPLAAPRLNALALNPDLIGFTRAALGTTDIRLYLAQAWAKYTGVTDYEQPLHQDHNHSLIPASARPGWLQLEGFVYLTDVDETHGPTRLVSTQRTGHIDERTPLDPEEHAAVYSHEVAAVGRRGSFLAYRPDVWHRATDLTEPGGSRLVLATSFKQAGADWIGYTALGRQAPNFWFQQLVASSSPDQLTVLGIPAPGHPFWTKRTVAQFRDMYPGLDANPWQRKLPT